jgi:hypothetical protein
LASDFLVRTLFCQFPPLFTLLKLQTVGNSSKINPPYTWPINRFHAVFIFPSLYGRGDAIRLAQGLRWPELSFLGQRSWRAFHLKLRDGKPMRLRRAVWFWLRRSSMATLVSLPLLTLNASAVVNRIFLATPTYSSEGAASSVAIADVSGDEVPDLIVANGIGVSILLGQGDGTFQAAVSYSSGGLASSSVAVADVNGDGNADVLVGAVSATAPCDDGPASCPGVVGVLLGNGDGSFQTAIAYASGGRDAVSVRVGDVDGDGRADLVVANLNHLAVLMGNGDGTFRPPVTVMINRVDSAFLALQDVNGDGRLDAVVASHGGVDGNGTLKVLLGNGDGTFQTPTSYLPRGHGANSLAVRDVNADGKVDLLVADTDANGKGTVEVLLGNGDGTFQPPVAHEAGPYGASSVSAGDVDGDGKLDLIVASSCSTCTDGVVTVLFGNGDGTFQSAVAYSSGGSGADFLAMGDLNGDGKSDVVVTNGAGVGVLLGNGNGTFEAGRSYGPWSGSVDSTVAGDVNADGKLDLIIVSLCHSHSDCNSGSVAVLLGNGDGTFQAAMNYSSGGALPLSVGLGDVNGDGKLDLIVANQCASNSNCPNDPSSAGVLGLLLGNGDGTFQPPVVYGSGGYRANSVAVGDINGDGNLDLVVANTCASGNSCANGMLGVLLGNGDGTFQPPVSYDSGGSKAQSVAVKDVNGDGKLDLVVVDYCGSGIACFIGTPTGVVGVLLGNGDGTFQPVVAYGSGGYAAYALAVADLNGDGKADLIAANRCFTFVCTSGGGIGVLLGNGDGTFQVAAGTLAPPPDTITNPEVGVQSLVVADFDGDGELDVAASGNSLLSGNGDGTFQAPITLGPGSPDIAAGDFNGDGKPDLVMDGGTIVLNMTSQIPYPTTIIATSSLSPSQDGQPVTIVAIVTPSFYAGPLTGTVTFYDGNTALSTASLIFGRATLNLSSLLPGMHSIIAIYNGDPIYQGSTSSALNKEILPPPVVVISAAPQQPVWRNIRGDFVALVTITNTGSVTIGSVQVTVAGTMLGTESLLSAPPPLKGLMPGASATVRLKFPPTAVTATNLTTRLLVSGTYSVTSFTPELSGTWSLSFRETGLQ